MKLGMCKHIGKIWGAYSLVLNKTNFCPPFAAYYRCLFYYFWKIWCCVCFIKYFNVCTLTQPSETQYLQAHEFSREIQNNLQEQALFWISRENSWACKSWVSEGWHNVSSSRTYNMLPTCCQSRRNQSRKPIRLQWILDVASGTYSICIS